MNRTVLVGRITKELDLRKTPSGASVIQFTLAVNRKNKVAGQPEADFINCVVWGKTAETMAQYLHKGSLIGIEGRIQTRNYDDNQGRKVYVTEVIVESFDFLEPKGQQQNKQSYNQVNQYQNQNTYQNTYQKGYEYSQSLTEQAEQNSYNDSLDIADDDLPF